MVNERLSSEYFYHLQRHSAGVCVQFGLSEFWLAQTHWTRLALLPLAFFCLLYLLVCIPRLHER